MRSLFLPLLAAPAAAARRRDPIACGRHRHPGTLCCQSALM